MSSDTGLIQRDIRNELWRVTHSNISRVFLKSVVPNILLIYCWEPQASLSLNLQFWQHNPHSIIRIYPRLTCLRFRLMCTNSATADQYPTSYSLNPKNETVAEHITRYLQSISSQVITIGTHGVHFFRSKFGQHNNHYVLNETLSHTWPHW